MCQNKLTELTSFEEVTDIINNNRDIRVEYCEDGTLMRLYNYNDSWHTATTRCMDARNSYWTSNKNFDTLFWEMFDSELLASLDKAYTYVFILLHKENRIVVSHNVNMIVYISRIHNETWHEDYTNRFINAFKIRRPKRLDVELIKAGIPFFNPLKRGILIKILNKETNVWKVYKYDFEKYVFIKSLRGNVPQIRMRYLELLKDKEKLSLFEKFYGEHRFMFNAIKGSVFNLAKMIHKLYIDSHIKHTIEVKQDNLYYQTLRQLHAQYKITTKPIGFYDVIAKIEQLDKNVIKRLLGWTNS